MMREISRHRGARTPLDEHFTLFIEVDRREMASLILGHVSSSRWPAAAEAPNRGELLLIHGMSSLAQTWWRAGPELARRGWDVVAVNQAGHGGAAAPVPLSIPALADAVLAQHPEPPDVLVGHSLGTITALTILHRYPGWAPVVILEEPPGSLFAGSADLRSSVSETVRADAATVRRDRPALERRVRAESPTWSDEDVHWAVEGIAQMDGEAYARWLQQLSQDPQLPGFDMIDKILTTEPAPYVLAALSSRSFMDGGSTLVAADREALQAGLPDGHLIGIEGGHCLHRDAFTAWLAAVDQIATESTYASRRHLRSGAREGSN